ncbi:Zinc finger, CCHC-type [Parasponia andersonii]|uniref:Zinc finger, CCHC-type n=1 Tax=Parasponia andersonii TaxID=3476 RepID=A0A2P5DDC9_PARAD|nr:Zinc finger, CCHC-type [Parasponia andersonii]
MLLIGSLPDELDYLCITLLHGKEKLSFDEVSTVLYIHEIQKKYQKENREMPAEAFAARRRSQSRKQEKNDKSHSKGRPGKNKCAFCHEKRHWKKDCLKLKNKGKGKATFDAYVAEVEDNESDFALVSQPMISQYDEWILDSGCTYYMCPHKEWFFNFEELNGGVFYIGNHVKQLG